MKAYELMALAAKEPEKYKGKEYEVVKGSLFQCGMERYKKCTIYNGKIYPLKAPFCDSVATYCDTEVEEIPQYVPFLEAVKAYSEKGKTIEVVDFGLKHKYTHCNGGTGMVDENGSAIGVYEILEGKWRILE